MMDVLLAFDFQIQKVFFSFSKAQIFPLLMNILYKFRNRALKRN